MSAFVVPFNSRRNLKLAKSDSQINLKELLGVTIDGLNLGEYYNDRITKFSIPINITAKLFVDILVGSPILDRNVENAVKEIKKIITKDKLIFVKENYFLINEDKILAYLKQNVDILYFLEDLPDILSNYFDKTREISLELEADFESVKDYNINILINTSDLSVEQAFQYLINFKSDFLLKKEEEFLRRIYINVT